MSRVISALLVLGMFASVVPAQVLAVEEEESAVVVEQQDVEQTEEPAAEEQQELTSGSSQTYGSSKGIIPYKMTNKTDANLNVEVSYAYQKLNLSDPETGTWAAGETKTFWDAVSSTSALLIFVKTQDGYSPDFYFDGEKEGDVYPIDKLPSSPGIGWNIDLSDEIEEAKDNGYEWGFYYTYWAFQFDRDFEIKLVPMEFDITYDLMGGDMPEGVTNPVTYNEDDLGTEGLTLNNPEREGYTFAGWTQDGVDAEPVKEMVIQPGTTGALSFTAHWNVAISFDSKGGSAVNDLEGYTAKVINDRSLPTPERAGYAFQGWYDEKGNAVKELPEVFPNENVTYTARWTKRTDLEYTVNYYKDSVAPENLIATDTNKGTFEDPISYTAGKYLPEGYAADKVTTSGATTIGADESKNVLNVVYGRRTDLSYTVNYVEDNTGKVLAGPDTVSGQTYGTEVTVYAKDIGGYSLMSTNPQKLSVGTGSNTITFYYREIGPDQPEVVTPSESPAPVAPVTPVTPVTPRTPTTPTTTVTTPTATPAPDAGDADEEEAEEEEVIEEEETPLTEEPAEEETITDEETPLAESASGWALLNLILAIVTVIGAVVLVIGYFAGYQTIWRLLSLIPAIGGVVAFFLTEDMSLPMAFVDNWTVLMVIIAVVQVVIAIMAMKDKEEDDEEA